MVNNGRVCTELVLQTTQEGFGPRRRIKTKKSEAELNDEELHRTLKEEMQQGLAAKDMGFTPSESDYCLNSKKCLDPTPPSTEGSTLLWQDVIQDQSHHNYNHIA